jgi:hypothetical protein
VKQRREDDNFAALVLEDRLPGAKLGRYIRREERVRQDVTFRMPAGMLRDCSKSGQFGNARNQAISVKHVRRLSRSTSNEAKHLTDFMSRHTYPWITL